MSDWMDKLSPEERADWDSWVQAVRKNTLEPMDKSAMVIQLYSPSEPDIKFAVEVGLSFLMDKPILAVVMPGAKVPGKLERVADVIIEADIDTEEGSALVAEAINAWKEQEG